jgi:translocation and assembly module TamB
MKRRWLWLAAATLAVLSLAAVLTIRSSWFREEMRGRIIIAVQRVTGGVVELGSFEWDWSGLRARITDFTLHGTEAKGRAPLFHAASAELRLTLLSLWNRQARLDHLTIEKPEIHIYFDSEGRSNLPVPAAPPSGRNAVEEILRLSIHRLELKSGSFEYDNRAVPFQIVADDFTTGLDWNSAGPSYRGRLTARTIAINGELSFGLDAPLVLEAKRVSFNKALIRRGESSLTLTGQVQDWKNLQTQGSFEGEVALADVPGLNLREGRLKLNGTVDWSPSQWQVSGNAAGRDLALRTPDFSITGIRATTPFRIDAQRVELPALEARLLDGNWKGRATIESWTRFQLEGEAQGFSLENLQRLRSGPPIAWNGVFAGPVSVSGILSSGGARDTRIEARLDVQPAEGHLPIHGQVALSYSQNDAVVEFSDSYLATPAANLRFRGTLGRSLDVGLIVTKTEDLEPIAALFRGGKPLEIPLRLSNGEARFEGRVTGPLAAPAIAGQFHLRNANFLDAHLDRFEARVSVTRDRLELAEIHAQRGAERAGGDLQVVLTDWSASHASPLSAKLRLEQAELANLIPDLKGSATGSLMLSGSLEEPHVELDVDAKNVEYAGERVQTAKLHLVYTDKPDDRLQGTLRLDEAVLEIDGLYHHKPGRPGEGEAEVRLNAVKWALRDIERLQRSSPGLEGAAEFHVSAKLAVAGGRPSLRSLEGTLSTPDLTIPSGPLGNLEANAWTEGDLLRVQSRINLRGRPLQATAQVKLSGDYAMLGKVTVPPIPFRIIRELLSTEKSAAPSPIQGIGEGEINFQGPLAAPDRITARAVLSRFVVRPREANVGELALDVTDLTLRNNGPLTFDLDRKGVHIRTAKFSAKETDLSLSGSFLFDEKSPWNLSAQGAINLAVLSTFKPDLQASGSSTLNATLRGRLDQPQLNGRMEIRRASFFLKDVPNGIEQANGTIMFDRNRANIERLSGQTGGGSFDLSGFIGIAEKEFTYRLQSNLNGVRVRYPEGVSTTLSANLSLTGTSVRSLVAGNITVLRSGFNPRADLASLVEQSTGKASGIPVQNEFLQGMQFDIRVRTAPNAELQTSYTRDVQTEADLRLRGSIAKPILLGRVKVNQGEVDFLGTRYNISRGEIIFYNTTTLQPAVDLDLETRVRGITVLVNFSGPINKLNVSYRSDPPLQSSEVLALLAVGRTPDSSRTSLGPSQNVIGQNTMPGGGGALLGGALSASVNGRLERFFGASRIKIDPTITGVENIPQARLTLEQQVSRDITVTFVTNLNRAQQQIWRVEWDLNREWSVVAVRDENGLFGVDFLVRKRFK